MWVGLVDDKVKEFLEGIIEGLRVLSKQLLEVGVHLLVLLVCEFFGSSLLVHLEIELRVIKIIIVLFGELGFVIGVPQSI